jgi:hypothetical protein
MALVTTGSVPSWATIARSQLLRFSIRTLDDGLFRWLAGRRTILIGQSAVRRYRAEQ